MKNFLPRSTVGLCAALLAAPGLRAQTSLYTPNGEKANDHFGASIAGLGDLNGDGRPDWAVGAPEDGNIFGPGEGYLRVYSGANGGVLFTLSGSAAGDGLGASVASVGDLNGDNRPEFVVGLPGAGANHPGRVLVYPAMGGSAMFTIFGASANDQLGGTVAGCGDVNGDGKADFMAGGPLASAGGTQRGIVQVFSGASGALLYTYTGSVNNERLGMSLAGCGDLNGDGLSDFLIGSSTAGARLYSGATGGLLRSFPTPANDRLGASVASLSDLDGDNVRDLALGAPQDGNLFTPGLGYVQVRSGATGALLFQLNGVGTGDRFGWSVGNARDLDGDGKSEIIVGADQYSIGGNGYVQVFSGNGGGLLYTFNGASANDRQGASVDGLGDLNGDGLPEFGFGVPNRSSIFSLGGQAQIWSAPFACPQPNTYCAATSNSSGGPATMSWSGSTSIAANSFTLQTSGAPPNKLGLYVYSPNQANTPVGNGVLCIGNPIVRLPATSTTGAGTASFPLNFGNLPIAGPIQAGDVRNFVLWFRDPPAGGSNFNFSNGLCVTFCP